MSERWAPYPGLGGAYTVSTGGAIRVATRRVAGTWVPEHMLTDAEIRAYRLNAPEMARQVWGAQYVPLARGMEIPDDPSLPRLDPNASNDPADWVSAVALEPGFKVEANAAPEFPTGRAAPTLPPEEPPKDSRKGKRERR